MPLQYTFWLMPSEPMRSKLRAIVTALSGEFGSPPFDPHLTVYAGPSDSAEALAIVDKIGSRFSSFELEMIGLEQSAIYSKTLFIQFKKSADLQRMYDTIRTNADTPFNYALNPHISILYHAKLTEEIRKSLTQHHSLAPVGTYRFEKICAVEYSSPWSEKSVKNCRVIAESDLG
jgi:hypothetical protein